MVDKLPFCETRGCEDRAALFVARSEGLAQRYTCGKCAESFVVSKRRRYVVTNLLTGEAVNAG